MPEDPAKFGSSDAIAHPYVDEVNKRMEKLIMRHACDNCQDEFPYDAGLVASVMGRHVSAICGACLEGVQKAKLVIRRGDVGGFAYDQYQPIEMRKAHG